MTAREAIALRPTAFRLVLAPGVSLLVLRSDGRKRRSERRVA